MSKTTTTNGNTRRDKSLSIRVNVDDDDGSFLEKANMMNQPVEQSSLPSDLSSQDEFDQDGMFIMSSDEQEVQEDEMNCSDFKRGRIILELYESEQNYFWLLTEFIQVFLSDLEQNDTSAKQSFMGDHNVVALCSIIQQIVSHSKQFLGDLKLEMYRVAKMIHSGGGDISDVDKYFDSGSPPELRTPAVIHVAALTNVGAVVQRYGRLLKLYEQYAANYGFANKIVVELILSSAFNSYWKSHSTRKTTLRGQYCANPVLSGTKNFRRPSLDGYLIQPIQRVPRYSLLLSDLYQATAKSLEQDRADLKSAICDVENVAYNMNEAIRKSEHSQELQTLQKRFIGGVVDLVGGLEGENTRWLVREGELMRVCRKETKPFYFHLFNDTLLYSEQTPLGFKLHRAMPIDNSFNFCSLEDSVLRFDDMDDADVPINLDLGFQIETPTKSFVVFAETTECMQAWLHDLETLKLHYKSDEVGPVDVPAPVWQSISASSVCQVCTKSFGMMRRRHHCRRCGLLVCDSCSDRKRVIRFRCPKPVRVCNVCKIEMDQVPKDVCPEQSRLVIRIDQVRVNHKLKEASTETATEISQSSVSESELKRIAKTLSKSFYFYLSTPLPMSKEKMNCQHDLESVVESSIYGPTTVGKFRSESQFIVNIGEIDASEQVVKYLHLYCMVDGVGQAGMVEVPLADIMRNSSMLDRKILDRTFTIQDSEFDSIHLSLSMKFQLLNPPALFVTGDKPFSKVAPPNNISRTQSVPLPPKLELHINPLDKTNEPIKESYPPSPSESILSDSTSSTVTSENQNGQSAPIDITRETRSSSVTSTTSYASTMSSSLPLNLPTSPVSSGFWSRSRSRSRSGSVNGPSKQVDSFSNLFRRTQRDGNRKTNNNNWEAKVIEMVGGRIMRFEYGNNTYTYSRSSNEDISKDINALVVANKLNGPPHINLGLLSNAEKSCLSMKIPTKWSIVCVIALYKGTIAALKPYPTKEEQMFSIMNKLQLFQKTSLKKIPDVPLGNSKTDKVISSEKIETKIFKKKTSINGANHKAPRHIIVSDLLEKEEKFIEMLRLLEYLFVVPMLQVSRGAKLKSVQQRYNTNQTMQPHSHIIPSDLTRSSSNDAAGKLHSISGSNRSIDSVASDTSDMRINKMFKGSNGVPVQHQSSIRKPLDMIAAAVQLKPRGQSKSKAVASLLRTPSVTILLQTVKQILNINEEFLTSMKNFMEYRQNARAYSIAHLFRQMVQIMDIYDVFMSNYLAALERIFSDVRTKKLSSDLDHKTTMKSVSVASISRKLSSALIRKTMELKDVKPVSGKTVHSDVNDVASKELIHLIHTLEASRPNTPSFLELVSFPLKQIQFYVDSVNSLLLHTPEGHKDHALFLDCSKQLKTRNELAAKLLQVKF